MATHSSHKRRNTALSLSETFIHTEINITSSHNAWAMAPVIFCPEVPCSFQANARWMKMSAKPVSQRQSLQQKLEGAAACHPSTPSLVVGAPRSLNPTSGKLVKKGLMCDHIALPRVQLNVPSPASLTKSDFQVNLSYLGFCGPELCCHNLWFQKNVHIFSSTADTRLKMGLEGVVWVCLWKSECVGVGRPLGLGKTLVHKVLGISIQMGRV